MDIGSSDRILMGHLIYKDNFFGSIVIPRGFRTNYLTAMLRQCRKGNWYRRNINKLKARSAYRSVRLMGASHWKK